MAGRGAFSDRFAEIRHERFHFAGFVTDLKSLVELYASHIIFLAPGPHETFGLAVLEAMASGLIVGPCTAPVLGSLLLYVASRQNVFVGAGLIFVFSLGMGASLLLAGIFSGFLSSLPKAGAWMDRLKKAVGVVFLVVAEIYLIKAGALF